MSARFAGRGPARPERAARVLGVTSGLRRRLLVMLIAPLILLSLLNAWFEYRSADSVAAQQDHRLLGLVPLLADSIIARGAKPPAPPVLLLAPALEEFLKRAPDQAAFAISDMEGHVLRGEEWLGDVAPPTLEPEFHSEERMGCSVRPSATRRIAVRIRSIQRSIGRSPRTC